MSDENDDDNWETIYDKQQEDEILGSANIGSANIDSAHIGSANIGVEERIPPEIPLNTPLANISLPEEDYVEENEDIVEDDDYETYDLEVYEKQYNQVVRLR